MYNLSERKKYISVLLSLIMPGLGQIYCGELLKGCSFLVFFIFSPLLLATIAVYLPDNLMFAGIGLAVLTALASYLYAVIDSYRLAVDKGMNYNLKEYNSPFFYLAAWLVGTVMILGTDQFVKSNVVHAYKIVTDSMAPTVLSGDYVLAKRAPFRHGPVAKGDIVIMVYPDDRSKVFIRSIKALPGETVAGQDGSVSTVPHGKVLVRGNREGALDSTAFGPVDMRDIVGRVTQIYYSRDGIKPRWHRIAKNVQP